MSDVMSGIRATATSTARLLARLGTRIDALSLDLARDAGAIARNAQAFADAARDQATSITRATPRITRLAQVAAALLARPRWLRLAAAARGHDELGDDDHRDLAKRATAYAAELRGGIAKLGQLASCRPDLVGAVWARELAQLQDEVPPVATEAIRQRIEAELGAPIAAVFAEFSDEPLAAASLAQVHAARLLDGTEVVVKVQVPGVEDVIAADIAALRAVANVVGDVPGVDLATLSKELIRALAVELDYTAEAEAMQRFAASAGPNVVVPKPIAHASSPRILTMTRVTGERLIGYLESAPIADRDRLLGALVGEVAEQILVRGMVHADPHPGNFLVTPEGQLAVLDFGCVLELSAAERAGYARLVLAIASGNRGSAGAELATLGFAADDPEQLVELAGSFVSAMRPGADVATLDWQAAFADQIAHAKQLGGLTMPPSFVLVGRVLATVAGLLARYRPAIQLHSLIVRHLAAAVG